jgi:hypothetical protein
MRMENLLTRETQRCGEDLKTPVWIMGSLVLQALTAVALLALSGYLLFLSVRKPHTAGDLRAAAVIFAVPALVSVTGWYGLWKRKLWGWWAACLCDWGIAAVFVYAVIDDGWAMIGWSLVGTTVWFVILSIWLATPATRKYYWKTPRASEESLSV